MWSSGGAVITGDGRFRDPAMSCSDCRHRAALERLLAGASGVARGRGRRLDEPAWIGADHTLADELLRPSVVYASAMFALRQAVAVRAFAHVTGGGLPGNLPRALPSGCAAVVERGAWPVPRIFREIQRLGDVADHEMARTFNLGIGMVAIVAPEDANGAQAALDAHGGSYSSLLAESSPASGRHLVHVRTGPCRLSGTVAWIPAGTPPRLGSGATAAGTGTGADDPRVLLKPRSAAGRVSAMAHPPQPPPVIRAPNTPGVRVSRAHSSSMAVVEDPKVGAQAGVAVGHQRSRGDEVPS